MWQVLQQQQQEREKQLFLQREQLAQQKSQLDQIQSLQNQLQVQLEEQKRQKTVGQPMQVGVLTYDLKMGVFSPHILNDFWFIHQLDMNGQPLHPYMDSQVGTRSLPNSASEMCLRSQEDHMETRSNIRKHSSMTRLDGDGVMFYGSSRRIVDSCVQTDDEDREERSVWENYTDANRFSAGLWIHFQSVFTKYKFIVYKYFIMTCS